MRTISSTLIVSLALIGTDAAAQVELALPAHAGQIFGVHYSSDGRYLATSSNTESVVWDVRAAHPLATVGIASTSSHISPDGKTLLLLAHAILGVDVKTGEARTAFAEDMRPKSMAATPDAKRAVIGGARGELALYEVSSGRQLWSDAAHKKPVSAVAVSHDGSLFASGAEDGTLKLWSAKGPVLRRELKGHTAAVVSIAISHDGRTVISGSQREVIAWDTSTGQPVETRPGSVLAVDVRKDGLLAIATTKGLTLLNLTSRREVTFGDGRFFAVAFSPDGKHLATSVDPYGSVLRILNVGALQGPATQDEARGHRKAIVALAYSPQGDMLVSASADQTVKLWDVRLGTVLATMVGSNLAPVRDVLWIPGSDQIAAAVGNEVVVWDSAGAEQRRLADHGSPVVAIDADAKGATLLSVSEAGKIHLWSTADGKAIATYDVEERVRDAALHPKGREIYVVSAPANIRVLNAKNGKKKREVTIDGALLNNLTLDRKGQQLLTAGEDGTPRLWKLNGRKPKLTLPAQATPVLAVAFDAKAQRMATGAKGGSVRLYDRKGQEQRVLEGHYDSGQGSAVADVATLAFSPDGKQLATGGGDRAIKIWDVATGKVLMTLSGFVPYQLDE